MNANVLATSVRVRFLAHTVTWATATRVVDGDTIWLALDGDGSGDARVRYLGIDTPDTHFAVECYGPEAKEPTHSPRRAKAGRDALFMRSLRRTAVPRLKTRGRLSDSSQPPQETRERITQSNSRGGRHGASIPELRECLTGMPVQCTMLGRDHLGRGTDRLRPTKGARKEA